MEGIRWVTCVASAVHLCGCALLVDLNDLAGDASGDAGVDAPSDAPFDAPNDVPTPSDAPDDTTDATPPNSISFVQANAGYGAGGSLDFLAATTAGDAIILVVANSSNSPGAVVPSDTANNVYVPILGPYNATDSSHISLFVVFGAKSIKTISVAPPDGGTNYAFYATEYKGLTKFDQASVGSTASLATDGLVSAGITTSAIPELVFAYAEAIGNLKPGTGFNARSTFDGNAIEDRIVNTAATYVATATVLGGQGDIVEACFH